MERINNQKAGLANLAERTLCWITLARRPLYPSELQCALAVEVDELRLHDDNFTDTECIVAACAGLVTIDEEANIIRLVHYTTQEYFIHKLDNWLPDAESYVTTTCLMYLSYPISIFDGSRGDFYYYAANNWIYHGRNATSIPPGVMNLLDSNVPLANSLRFQNRRYYKGMRRDMPPNPLHVVSSFGFVQAITALLDLQWPIDSRDGLDMTPLACAAQQGEEASIKLLRERCLR